jgi:hypothetical protein
VRVWIFIAALMGASCRGEPSGGGPSGGGPPTGKPTSTAAAAAPAGARRFDEVRKLLAQDPESRTRAYQLYPIVDAICATPDERESFTKDVIAQAIGPQDENAARRIEALDTLEHVATACARNNLPAARDLLARVRAAIPKDHRPEELEARLLAAAGDLPGALESADRARALGSHHAIPLVATIQAQMAREKAVGYRAGMLDEAIATVSVEPDHGWGVLDLTALLSTRARLLSERAIWETGDDRKKTLLDAKHVYLRLSTQPFIEKTRQHALDMLCFDSIEIGVPEDLDKLCRRAAEEASILGAAFIVGIAKDPKKYDLERLERIKKLAERLESLPQGSAVIVVGRGDESELIPWVRPAAEAMSRLLEKKVKLIAVDRTNGPRAGALFDRMIELSRIKPMERIDAERDTFAMACLTAILAKRKTPESCPFDKGLEQRIRKLDELGVALLVGRDLDAEIEDLRLYNLPDALLSFRLPATEKGIDVQLKSVSDVVLISSRGKHLWGDAGSK